MSNTQVPSRQRSCAAGPAQHDSALPRLLRRVEFLFAQSVAADRTPPMVLMILPAPPRLSRACPRRGPGRDVADRCSCRFQVFPGRLVAGIKASAATGRGLVLQPVWGSLSLTAASPELDSQGERRKRNRVARAIDADQNTCCTAAEALCRLSRDDSHHDSYDVGSCLAGRRGLCCIAGALSVEPFRADVVGGCLLFGAVGTLVALAISDPIENRPFENGSIASR